MIMYLLATEHQLTSFIDVTITQLGVGAYCDVASPEVDICNNSVGPNFYNAIGDNHTIVNHEQFP